MNVARTFVFWCIIDASSGYFGGSWTDLTTCRSNNFSVTISSSLLCAREIDEVFLCNVTDVKIEGGKLPTNISFSDLRNSTVGKLLLFVVNGTAVKHPSTLMLNPNAVFNTTTRGIEFGEYNIPNARCEKSWKKKGRLRILM